MRRPRISWKTVAVTAAVFVCALLIWVWRDPMVLVRGELARQRWMAGLSLHHAEVAGHRWAYAERGAKDPAAPTLVMIHGFTGSKENWYPLAERLVGQYRVVIPDLPGWGASERKAGEDYGFDAQNRRLAEFIARVARRPGSPLVLLGHSMGGGIVALTAADRPDLVDRVALIDAAGVRFRDNVFGEQVLAGHNPFAVHDEASLKRYLDTVFHREEAKPSIPWPASRGLIDWRRAQAPFEQAVLDRIGRGSEAFLPGQAAAHIRQPTLLLWCAQDRVIDPSALELYAERIPQAVKVRLSDCGHMSIMERPDDVAAAVDYLIRNGVPR
ncbi:alpha/beta hydrolase [Pseudoxanthomonas sp. PXM04]|uniref:alpha/beta fold hydrolase n=1 Tax=Pseudoxanthomonas sp. PXM04 TaxID=2769297 RepID=UPI00177CB232|nr:alpha/beta hydrolase [Pseudoxanthomonas sp. PXM04]MBD9377366.1 alpha/beta hydrolase [Pseudoxanthomonas sp. PXM04]